MGGVVDAVEREVAQCGELAASMFRRKHSGLLLFVGRSPRSGSGPPTPDRRSWPSWARPGPAEESTFRRTFALVSADVLDRVLDAWLWTRAAQAGGRPVIAIDGKTVRGAKNKDGKAPHLVAALAHGIGTVLGQVAVDAKSNEIPAVRKLLKAFADLAGAILTIGMLCRVRHNMP
jgi:hypothetical protein